MMATREESDEFIGSNGSERWDFLLRGAVAQDGVRARGDDVGRDLEASRRSRFAARPGEQRGGVVGAGDMRERVAAAEARIEIEHVEAALRREKIAVEQAVMREPLAERAPERIQPF